MSRYITKQEVELQKVLKDDCFYERYWVRLLECECVVRNYFFIILKIRNIFYYFLTKKRSKFINILVYAIKRL